MKTLTQTFEEILNDKSNYVEAKEAGIGVFYVERALPKLIQAVKARDEEVLGEEPDVIGDGGYEVRNGVLQFQEKEIRTLGQIDSFYNNTVAHGEKYKYQDIKQKMEETI